MVRILTSASHILTWGGDGGGEVVGLVTVSPMRILNFKSLGSVRLVDKFCFEEM